MSLRPKLGSVAVFILGVYTHREASRFTEVRVNFPVLSRNMDQTEGNPWLGLGYLAEYLAESIKISQLEILQTR